MDRDLRILYVNDWLAGRFGLSVEEMLGRTTREVLGREIAEEYEPHVRRVLATGETTLNVESVIGPPEARRYFWVSYYPFRSRDGEVIGVSSIGQEVTKRRRAEEALRESEEHLRLLSDNLPAIVGVVDRDMRFRVASRGYAQQFGLSAEGIRGMHLRDVLGEFHFARIGPFVERALEGQTVAHEADVVLPTGTVHSRTVLTPLFDATGAVSGVHAMVQDISEIHRAQVELRELAGRLITAQEEERSRVARELHDDLTQRLASLAIDVGAAERELDLEGDGPLRKIHLELVQLSSDVRTLARQLHPSILSDLGLVEALRSECAALREREGIEVAAELCTPSRELPSHVLLGLYRVAQEALRNIVRHARVDTASLRLEERDGSLVLCVTDTGAGFDPDDIGRRGLGLESMRERMRALGGQLTVESQPGSGTRVEACVPISEA